MTTNTDNHKYFGILAIVGASLCLAAMVALVCPGFAYEFGMIRSDRSISPCTRNIQCLLVLAITVVAWVSAVVIAWEVWRKKSFADMIHAVLSVTIYLCVVSAWTIALWPWLADGKGSNADTIAKIALASAAIPTVLFVIWRERIASDASLDRRFDNAINGLGNPTESVRIAAIYSLRQFRPYAHYRNAALAALRSHLATCPGLIRPILPQRENTATNDAIRHLE